VQKQIYFLIFLYSFLIFPFSSTFGWAAAKPSVTIHNLINLTGIYASISGPYEKGGEDFLSWIGDQGGLDVNGDRKGDVEIKYLWAETGDSEAQWMSAYKRFRMGRARFNLLEMIFYPKPRISILEMWPSPDLNFNLHIKTALKKDHALGFGASLHEVQIDPPAWSYIAAGSDAEMAVGALEYFIDHIWPKRGNTAKPRVALITWEKAFSKTTGEFIKKYAAMTGKFEVADEKFFTEMPGDKEISVILPEWQKSGIDIIWSNSTIQTSAVIMKAFHKLGLSNQMFLLGNPSSPPDLLLQMMGHSIAEGFISPQSVSIPVIEPEEPGVKFANMLNEKYRKGSGLPNIHYMNGIRMKAMMLESVRRALVGMMERDKIDLVRACKLINGKEIKELGVQTLAGYSAYGMTTVLQSAPANKNDRRLTDHSRLIGIKDGKVTILSPWYKVPRPILR